MQTLPRRNLPLRSSAMFNGPVAGLASSSESASLFSVVRLGVRPGDCRPMRRKVRVAGPTAPSVMLESWSWRGLSGRHSPLRQSSAAGSRAAARLSASRVGGGVVSFKFVLASRSRRVSSFSHLQVPVSPPSGLLVTALPLAGECQCPRLSPASGWEMLLVVEPVVSAHRPQVAQSGSMFSDVSRWQ